MNRVLSGASLCRDSRVAFLDLAIANHRAGQIEVGSQAELDVIRGKLGEEEATSMVEFILGLLRENRQRSHVKPIRGWRHLGS